jgi:hypothetical protein
MQGNLRQSIIYQEQAALDQPDDSALKCLCNQGKLGSESASADFVWCESDSLSRIDQISACLEADVYAGYQNRVTNLDGKTRC